MELVWVSHFLALLALSCSLDNFQTRYVYLTLKRQELLKRQTIEINCGRSSKEGDIPKRGSQFLSQRDQSSSGANSNP